MSPHAFAAPVRRRRAFAALIWLLVAALVAYGCSSVLVQLLGPAHRHTLAAPSTIGWLARAGQSWHELQAWRASLHARWLPQAGWEAAARPQRTGGELSGVHLLAAAEQAHAHAHATFQRHHHGAHDPTVMALERTEAAAGADGGSSAGAGSATLPLGLASVWVLPAVPVGPAVWQRTAADRWTDATRRLIDQPPRG